MKKYEPVDSLSSPRFSGVRTFMRLPQVRTIEDIDFAVVGIPFDSGVSFRPGARFGPGAIRDISVLLKPFNIYHGIDIFEHLSGVDYGDLSTVPGYVEDSLRSIEEGLTPMAEREISLFAMGGDHTVTLGELRALAKKNGPLSLVHIDAHLDTAEEYFGKKYNHGTPFSRASEEGIIDPASSIQVGIRGSLYGAEDIQRSLDFGFQVVTANEVFEKGLEPIIEEIRKRVGKKKVFISFDIDSVDPAYAPGTGTVETGGFTSREALQIVRGLKGLNIIGMDVVEVLPAFDPQQVTALLAANLIMEGITLAAINKRDKKRTGMNGVESFS